MSVQSVPVLPSTLANQMSWDDVEVESIPAAVAWVESLMATLSDAAATITIRDAVLVGVREIERSGVYSDQNLPRLVEHAHQFSRFALMSGTVYLRDLTDELVQEWVLYAVTSERKRPSNSTKHHRRTSIRVLFRALRRCRLVVGDPVLDLTLEPRSKRRVRPLTDDEVGLCRDCATIGVLNARPRAAFALAEAGAVTGEIGFVRVGDVDVTQRSVHLPGNANREPRTAQLDTWQFESLRIRVAELGDVTPDTPLIYEGRKGAASRQVSSNNAVRRTLVRAGLAAEPDVVPESVNAWLGVTVMDRTRSIEEVARTLGIRSLDTAARLIGHDWRATS